MHEKSNNLKVMMGRVVILVYVLALLIEIFQPMKFKIDIINSLRDMVQTKIYHEKIEKASYSKIMKGWVIILVQSALLNEIWPRQILSMKNNKGI